jgi:hypothetical protein
LYRQRQPAKWILVWLVLAACPASIIPQYEAARADALADPGPPPEDWKPDAILALSESQVDEMAGVLVEVYGRVEDRVETFVLGVPLVAEPKLAVKDVAISGSGRCKGCVAVDAKLAGDVKWSLGPKKGVVPVRATAGFDCEFVAQDEGGVFDVTLVPRDVHALDLHVGSVDASASKALEQGLAEGLRERLLKDAKPIEVSEFGSADVPLRALRVVADGTTVRVAMLTRAPTPGAVSREDLSVTEGYRLVFSQDSLLDLARAEGFRAGAVSHDVVVEPTALALGKGTFDMGVRLWRPLGKGWWRDYQVRGVYRVDGSRVKLDPKDVTEGDKSKGAMFVDPLAALGEGLILKALEDSVATTLPLRQRQRAGQVRAVATVDGASGEAGKLFVDGRITLKPAAAADPRR